LGMYGAINGRGKRHKQGPMVFSSGVVG
jgi:hypothetical protein